MQPSLPFVVFLFLPGWLANQRFVTLACEVLLVAVKCDGFARIVGRVVGILLVLSSRRDFLVKSVEPVESKRVYTLQPIRLRLGAFVMQKRVYNDPKSPRTAT